MFLSPKSYKIFYETLRNINCIKQFFVFESTSDSNVTDYKYLVGNNVDLNTYKVPKLKGKRIFVNIARNFLISTRQSTYTSANKLKNRIEKLTIIDFSSKDILSDP